MSFSVGDEVICVDAMRLVTLRRGAIYHIANVRSPLVDLAEFPGELMGFYQWRFIKLPKEKARTEPIEVGVE